MRGGRSADRRTGAALSTGWARHNAADQALARRLASSNVGRSPLGAPPWRFLGSGSALPSAALPPQLVQRGSSRRRSYCLAGGFPCLPESAVTSRSRGTPHLAPPMDRLRKTPLDERDKANPSLHSICSQYLDANCRRCARPAATAQWDPQANEFGAEFPNSSLQQPEQCESLVRFPEKWTLQRERRRATQHPSLWRYPAPSGKPIATPTQRAW
jgi:hypothetical protein